MKALTLTEPWATLVSIGAKTWETRDWSTQFRGPLAIHSAKSFPLWAIDLCLSNYFASALFEAFGPDYIDMLHSHRGKVLATCQITACLPTGQVIADPRFRLSPRQRAFGNWEAGRSAWRLEDIVRVDPPVPARGSLGLWEWDNEAAGVHPLVTGTLF